MIYWVAFSALALAAGAIIGWIKAREDAREWADIARTMNWQYERLQLELAHRTSKVNVVEQRSQWLN